MTSRPAAILKLLLFFSVTPLSAADNEEADRLAGAAAPGAPAETVGSFPAGKKVRRVIAYGRWSHGLDLPLRAGDLLTNEKISATLQTLRRAISGSSTPGETGRVMVLFIDVDYTVDPTDDTVEVSFKPYHVDLALTRLGDAVLPLPRSSFPSYLQNVPGVLRVLNPSIGFTHDEAYGPALQTATSGTIATVGGSGADGALGTLDHRTAIARSLSEDFQRLAGQVGYVRKQASGRWREWRFDLGYASSRDPLGDNEQKSSTGHANAGAFLRLGPHARLALDAGYHLADDDVRDASGSVVREIRTHAQNLRVLFEGLPPARWGGFVRAAAWWDHGSVEDAPNYHRIAARVGYEREFLIAPSQSIGVELLGGGGTASRATPETARFFGGNEGANFIYDDRHASSLLTAPRGPLIRSFGRARAGLPAGITGPVAGGDGYWHINLNVSLPIPRWSRPLIPNEETDFPTADGRPITLRRILKNQIHVSGRSMLAQHFVTQGLSLDAANREAAGVLEEIRPATEFIIDHANIFAVKPVLMLDAAGLRDQTTNQRETWVTAGAGLELHVVNVKVEAGYFRTVSGPTFGDRDNVAVRLVFRNLF